MTLATLFPPVAAATVLNVFMFAFLWRSDQTERSGGKAAWYFYATWFFYLAPVVYVLWRLDHKPITEKWEVLGAITGAQMFAALVVYTLVNGLVTMRGTPWHQRGPAMGAALFFLAIVIAGFLQAPI